MSILCCFVQAHSCVTKACLWIQKCTGMAMKEKPVRRPIWDLHGNVAQAACRAANAALCVQI